MENEFFIFLTACGKNIW